MSPLRTTTLLTSSFLLTIVAHAQVRVSLGPTVGGNLATQHIAADNTPNVFGSAPNLGYHLDWLAGAQASVDLGRFAVQPALLLSQKGFKNDNVIDYRDANNLPIGQATIHNNVRLSYLSLPVNFCFAPLGAKTGPQLFVGPYVSVLLSARDVHTDANSLPNVVTITDHLKVAETLDLLPNNYGFRHLDAGLQGGVGYRYEAYQLQVSYSLGLRNTVPTYVFIGTPITSSNNYNRSFQASLAYLFSATK